MENSKTSDKLLVFETQHAKIGPLIYFESDRSPIWLERGFNSLGVTDAERERLIHLLTNDRNVRVVLIGQRPPSRFKNANYIYDFIIRNYVIEEQFPTYTPYPRRLENLSVMLLRDIRLVSYTRILQLNLSNFRGASFKVKNNTLQLSDTYFSGYTIFYRFDEPIDLSSSVLSIQIMGGNETNRLYVDLIDVEGVFTRHQITYSANWSEAKAPINYLAFVRIKDCADLHKVKQINLVIIAENRVDLSIRNMILSEFKM